VNNGVWRGIAVAIAAIGVMIIAGALLQPDAAPDGPTIEVIPDRFAIDVQLSDGTSREAAVLCEGDIKGTGYLASAQASFSACTFDKKVNIHRYLQAKADCNALIADAASLPERLPLGVATITGIYFDKPIERTVDAANGTECDRAVWKLLAPLIGP
jgi:hypothetical protein